MPEKTEAQKRAQKNYMGKFAVARVRLGKEKFLAVQVAAKETGESLNTFIEKALDLRMEAGK